MDNNCPFCGAAKKAKREFACGTTFSGSGAMHRTTACHYAMEIRDGVAAPASKIVAESEAILNKAREDAAAIVAEATLNVNLANGEIGLKRQAVQELLLYVRDISARLEGDVCVDGGSPSC